LREELDKMASPHNSSVRVSWLLCTNKHDKLLHRAIASCLDQSIRDFELLLIVNGQESAKIAEQLTKILTEDDRVRI